MDGKKEIYRDVRFFHGALQLSKRKTLQKKMGLECMFDGASCTVCLCWYAALVSSNRSVQRPMLPQQAVADQTLVADETLVKPALDHPLVVSSVGHEDNQSIATNDALQLVEVTPEFVCAISSTCLCASLKLVTRNARHVLWKLSLVSICGHLITTVVSPAKLWSRLRNDLYCVEWGGKL